MTLINEYGEFVDPEPVCPYPKLAAIDASRLIPYDDGSRVVGFGRFERVCSECGTKFRTSSNQQVTCCGACSRTRKIRLQKEKRRKAS